MTPTYAVADAVRLRTPDNPRLDGAPGMIAELHPWGAVVLTGAAAAGRYRAALDELEPLPGPSLMAHAGDVETTHGEYVGSPCDVCGGANLVRTGTCTTCLDCGSTTGC